MISGSFYNILLWQKIQFLPICQVLLYLQITFRTYLYMNSFHFSDEINAEKIQSTNLLADLSHRFFDDVDEIVTWLRSQESQSKSEYERKLPLVRIHREKRLASNDQRFETVAYMVGLAERINASLDKRHRTDQSRQRELARLLMVVRTARVSTGLPYQKQLDEKYRPSQGKTRGIS